MKPESPDIVLECLMEGNRRYVAGRMLHPHQTPERRRALRERQAPSAAILGCADSRVPPEVIFDQGLGDLFVVRVAGNIVDEATLGSLEYAVLHLGTPLVMVLGHRGCGAVKAAIEAVMAGEAGKGHLRSIIAAIRPAIAEAQMEPGDLLESAVRAHIRRSIQQLLDHGLMFAAMVREGRLKIVGACYDLESGQVELLENAAD